jgi:hypothetical protein
MELFWDLNRHNPFPGAPFSNPKPFLPTHSPAIIPVSFRLSSLRIERIIYELKFGYTEVMCNFSRSLRNLLKQELLMETMKLYDVFIGCLIIFLGGVGCDFRVFLFRVDSNRYHLWDNHRCSIFRGTPVIREIFMNKY